jgi:hypothetical protein
MTSAQYKKIVFNSIEEVIKEYLPNSLLKEEGERIIDPQSLGVLLAKTEAKNARKLVERNY